MEQKDPKDMTVSELLREADSSPCSMCHLVMDGDESCATTGCASWAYRLADKIDAEIVKAYSEKLNTCAMRWAKANGWPDFREGEDFGAWLERCALKRPCYEDGEPVRDSSEWKAIMMSLDGSRFQLLKSYPDGLCFTGSPVKRPDPDTQERIDEDAQKSNQSYWGCEGRSCKVCPAIIDGAKPCERYDVFSCDNAKTLDLLRRQRELDARKGGAE